MFSEMDERSNCKSFQNFAMFYYMGNLVALECCVIWEWKIKHQFGCSKRSLFILRFYKKKVAKVAKPTFDPIIKKEVA